MTYKEYNYGEYRKEIRRLLRTRLYLLSRIRYHEHKIAELQVKIPACESEIDRLLLKAAGRGH